MWPRPDYCNRKRLTGATTDDTPRSRPGKGEAVIGFARQVVQHTRILIGHSSGHRRIVEVSRIDELIRGIFEHALRTCSGTERATGHEGQLMGTRVEHIPNDAALRIGRAGVVALVSHVDPFARSEEHTSELQS